MRKSTLFISATLTAFLVALLFGVVSAYQKITQKASEPAPKVVAAQPVVVDFPSVSMPTPIPVLVISAEQATTIAVDFLGNPDVYSVEVVTYEGAQAFLVTFSSGDLVYVSSTGIVLANSKLQPVVVTTNGGGNGGGNQSNVDDGDTGGSNNQTSGEGEEHENEEHGDDHEGDHD
ncbi:MAG TPA: hypothetical protein PLX14_05775 [Anaerolineales bacterium]|nr:hypothetical protein [Anaerolineales bacterium]